MKAKENEQYSLCQNASVTGFEDEVDENCSAKFVTLCREKIGLDISDIVS